MAANPPRYRPYGVCDQGIRPSLPRELTLSFCPILGLTVLGVRGLQEAERRQVTVLFTDMVGFTSYSERE